MQSRNLQLRALLMQQKVIQFDKLQFLKRTGHALTTLDLFN